MKVNEHINLLIQVLYLEEVEVEVAEVMVAMVVEGWVAVRLRGVVVTKHSRW